MKREARMANLGEADRRVAGLGSWPVVLRICLRPSAHEPAARDAEGKRPVSLRCLSKWTVALAAAAAVCCGERERERDPLVIGDNPNTSGNSFSYGVSAEFREPELRHLYSALNGPGIRAKLQRHDKRLENGLGYLVEQAVKALDKGPPIDYGSRNPH